MAETMKEEVATMLKGIDRYNPENLETLKKYLDLQVKENSYDLEANLAILKLYQFNPTYYQTATTAQIMLKALTNLPHTDFVLCKCLLEQGHLEEVPVKTVLYLAELLETCQFKTFWVTIQQSPEIITGLVGFEDSIRKFICHVVGITYQTIERTVLQDLLGGISEPVVKQWMVKQGWKEMPGGIVFITNQEENIKTKNITEKIDFESVAGIMAACR